MPDLFDTAELERVRGIASLIESDCRNVMRLAAQGYTPENRRQIDAIIRGIKGQLRRLESTNLWQARQ